MEKKKKRRGEKKEGGTIPARARVTGGQKKRASMIIIMMYCGGESRRGGTCHASNVRNNVYFGSKPQLVDSAGWTPLSKFRDPRSCNERASAGIINDEEVSCCSCPRILRHVFFSSLFRVIDPFSSQCFSSLWILRLVNLELKDY